MAALLCPPIRRSSIATRASQASNMHIDHINIKAPADLMEAEKRFFCEILNLREGQRPDFGSQGYWLYCDDQAIVHLSLGEPQTDNANSSYFDHVAFRSTGLKPFAARLTQAGVAYRSNFVAEHNMTQLFLKSATGTGIEVNFIDEVI
jgi:catechol 2,3-dioxygenase-like lactoylglutathione lyase family enzyme